MKEGPCGDADFFSSQLLWTFCWIAFYNLLINVFSETVLVVYRPSVLGCRPKCLHSLHCALTGGCLEFMMSVAASAIISSVAYVAQ